MNNLTSLDELISYIDPSVCDYQEWCNIGMALKHEGYSVAVWDEWSRRDAVRYHPGECEKKWQTFHGGSHSPVTAGTIVAMAKEHGWSPAKKEGRALDWEDTIDEDAIINPNWIEGQDIIIPDKWEPEKQLIKYLETLFDSTENVGYVTESWKKDDKYMPSKGCSDRTAGELIEALNRCGGDIGAVLGDYNPEVGAWIRFNPLDGKGVKDSNVTDYRYALIESDSLDLAKQNAIIRELELPVAALVFSGKKSLHAIIKVEAADYNEYRKRVDYLYDICRKNGLQIDKQNRNPSRLSRMPGVIRGEQKQYLLDTNIGQPSWNEWQEWIEGINDDLPEPENFSQFWDNLPELAPPLIDGVLRQGHKMLIAGPSKAGKSYALVELCISLAEGINWLGFKCAQGKVLYINLEVDSASCLHRFKDVYTAMKLKPSNLSNIDIWNLRGKAVPMDKLAPKIIRRAAKKHYIAIIIDPIYKVITGDENSAEQMSKFCNQFDKVCNELGCAVIYCHHHSKGAQGDKRSMDRASGSGVFARDPDALLDLIELEIDEKLFKQQLNDATCQCCFTWLDRFYPNGWDNEVSQDDICSEYQMKKACKRLLSESSYQLLLKDIENTERRLKAYTAWRIEGTLREFPKFQPLNLWFKYPVHVPDKDGVLADLSSGGFYNKKGSPYQRNFSKKKPPEEKKKDRNKSLLMAFTAAETEGRATIKEMAEFLGVSNQTVKNYIAESNNFCIANGVVMQK